MRSRPKGGGECSVSRDEFDAAHQGGDVDPHRYRISFAHHNTNGSRVDDDMLGNAVVYVEYGFRVVEQYCGCVCWTSPPQLSLVQLLFAPSSSVVLGFWPYPRLPNSTQPRAVGCH